MRSGPEAQQWYGGRFATADRRHRARCVAAAIARRAGRVRCGPVRLVVPPAGDPSPIRPSTRRCILSSMAGMEAIQASHLTRRPSLVPLLGGTVLGTILIVVGIVLAYMAFATPVLQTVVPAGRLNVGPGRDGHPRLGRRAGGAGRIRPARSKPPRPDPGGGEEKDRGARRPPGTRLASGRRHRRDRHRPARWSDRVGSGHRFVQAPPSSASCRRRP